MIGAVNGNIPRPVTTKVKRHIWETFSDLKVYTSTRQSWISKQITEAHTALPFRTEITSGYSRIRVGVAPIIFAIGTVLCAYESNTCQRKADESAP